MLQFLIKQVLHDDFCTTFDRRFRLANLLTGCALDAHIRIDRVLGFRVTRFEMVR